MMQKGPLLVTGAAGFIGFHVSQALLARGETVVGVDNLTLYYDLRLKQARLDMLRAHPHFRFDEIDLADRAAMDRFAAGHPEIDRIVHLAAQAGVRHSMIDPYSYVASNVMGHLGVLELARRLGTQLRHMVYASSSSVYGANTKLPFSEADRVETPQSLYAATKIADEMMGHAYAHLYAIPQTGLRFFTVYGPWGRPDMAYFSFAESIANGRPIMVYDEGRLRRDFTYIDDIVAGVIGALDNPPEGSPPHRVLNIGNHASEAVSTLIALLEAGLGRRALIKHTPRPAADVVETFADIERIGRLTGFAPATPLSVGVPKFVTWYQAWRAGR